MVMESESTIVQSEKKSEQLAKLSDWLIDRLEYCANHKRRKYSAKWERFDRMVKGVYENSYDQNNKNENWKSQLYYNVVEQKRQSAIAQIEDAMGNGGKFPFSLSQTPESETEEKVNQQLMEMGVDMEVVTRDTERRIDDNLLESKSYSEVRKTISDGTKYGVACFESPFIYKDKSRKINVELLGDMPEIPHDPETMEPDMNAMEHIRDKWLKESVIPTMKLEDIERIGFKRIRPADTFPDPACEGDSQQGFGIFVRKHYSPATLREMADEVISIEGQELDKYDRESIKKILDRYYKDREGYSDHDYNANYQTNRHDLEGDELTERGIPIYTFYGDVMRSDIDMTVRGVEDNDSDDDLSGFDTVSIIADFHRDGEVLRVIENPHPSGKRPIHLWNWERVEGEWGGKGICEKLEGLQYEFNRFLRYWVDNKLLSSSVIFGVVAGKVDRSENEDMSLYPGKIFYLRNGERINEIMQQYNVADVSGAFLEGINRLLDLIDLESGVPRIIQGQGNIVAKTAFETQQQESHALKQLGAVIKNIDEVIIAGVEMIYQYLLYYGENQGGLLGDFKISATGFATFESKRVKMMELDSILQLAMSSPEAMVHFNMRKVFEDKVKIFGVDADKYLNPIEVVQQTQQAQAQQAQQEQMMALQMAGEEKMADARAKIAVEQAKAELKAGLDQANNMAKSDMQRESLDHDMKKKIIDVEESKGDE